MGDVLRVLIRDHLQDIGGNRLPQIQRATKLDIPTIRDAIAELQHLDPKPGLKYARSETEYVKPDVIAERKDDGSFHIRLTNEWIPEVRVSGSYAALLQDKRLTVEEREQLLRKQRSAGWLVNAIERRRKTLLKVTRAIIEHQRPFLDVGPEHIQPLRMQQIAELVKRHVTTVSRAVNGKWVDTPRGMFPLRRFFGGGRENEQTGQDVAYEVIKQKLREVVDGEDKSSPLSDDELVAKLNESGHELARRTVTKYRKMLNIPSSRQRKDWSLS